MDNSKRPVRKKKLPSKKGGDKMDKTSTETKVLHLDKKRKKLGAAVNMDTENTDNPVEMREVVVTIPVSSVENLKSLGLLGVDQHGRDIIDAVSFTVYGATVIGKRVKTAIRKEMAYSLLLIGLILGGLLLLSGCGDYARKDCYIDGEGCELVGPPGPPGPQGPAGQDGSSCTSTAVTNGAIISCSDGTQVVLINGVDGIDGLPGRDGLDGTDGVDGIDGVNGQDGTDGQNGEDGADAPPTPYTVVGLVDPCGTTPGFNEVVLRLADGSLLAHYSNGARQFLTVLVPGTYTTTQGAPECQFTVHPDGLITDELGNQFNP